MDVVRAFAAGPSNGVLISVLAPYFNLKVRLRIAIWSVGDLTHLITLAVKRCQQVIGGVLPLYEHQL